jgi:AraC-like DNA-binding protein
MKQTKSYVLTAWAISCLHGFNARDLDTDLILKSASISDGEFENDYLPVASVVRIFEAAQSHYGDDIGLIARLGIVPNSFQSLSLAALSAPNFYQALQIMVKYQPYISDAIHYSFQEADNDVIFSFELLNEAQENAAIADAVLATTVRTLRFIMPYKRAVECVYMARPEPNSTREHDTYFKTSIQWGSSSYALKLNKKVLLSPSIHRNADLQASHEHACIDTINQLHGQKFTGTVITNIAALLAYGNVSADDIATELSISTRTLQRRLSEEGSTFSDVLQHVKFIEAKKLLLESNKTISEVTQLLGFSDSGNFSRAFKKWSDLSPQQYRTKHSKRRNIF